MSGWGGWVVYIGNNTGKIVGIKYGVSMAAEGKD